MTSSASASVPIRALLLTSLIWTVHLPVAAAEPRQWFTLTIDGQRVGHAYFEQESLSDGRANSSYFRVAVTQLRKTSSVERKVRVIRDAHGRLKDIEVSSISGLQKAGWRGQYDARSSTLRRKITTRTDTQIISLPKTIRGPDELIDALEPLRKGTGKNVSYSYLDPSLALPRSIQATVIERRPDSVVIRVTNDPNVAQLEIDLKGQLRTLEQPFMGATLKWAPCVSACDASVDVPFDPIARLTVASPNHIPLAATRGTIRYLVSGHDARALPLTSEQSVTRRGNEIIITICKDCGTEPKTDAGTVARYLKPNAWIQSDYAELRSFARRATGGRGSLSSRMRLLTEAVRAHMTGPVDLLGYATAADALRSRSGDCTEYATLLAAAARAEGVPSRIAIGLVYAARFSG
ncbi:MAG TPA: transglutaminase-like domain-containing protein, partial [Steroidobacteraceae bacterium]|nr:transglutaminase-like domain-containing protein [Steroidobacteraceae bacterium]